MIVVSTYKQKYKGKTTVFASHLVDTETLESSPCPWVPVSEMGDAVRFDARLGEYVVVEKEERESTANPGPQI